MANLIQRINELITQSSNKNKQIEDLKHQLEVCQNSLIEKEAEVSQLSEQLDEIQSQIQALQDEVIILQEQNNQLNAEKQENTQLLSDLDAAITRLEEFLNAE
ncbi:hypothetical protein [Turicibacter bilis]|uniref:hypothetical protein n=1 Tax=Turicibacter bilis TaxID=2735723 RepID=UPI0031BACA4D